MKAKLAASLGLSLGLLSGLGGLGETARAQNASWRTPQAAPAPAVLGRPIMEADPVQPWQAYPDTRIRPASYQPPTATLSAPQSPPAASSDGWAPATPRLGPPLPVPTSSPGPQFSTSNAVVHTVNQQPHAAPPPPSPPPYGAPPPPPAYGAPPPPPAFGAPPPAYPGAGNPIPPPPAAFGGGGPGLMGCEWLGCTTGCGRKMFQSDPCFEKFISPVTNPFLFEDPRSLTEVRTVFMYQRTPGSNSIYDGGNMWFLGAQGRLAITERLSLVVHKLGYIWNDPKNDVGAFQTHTGFAELWLGPKLTFWRNERTGLVAAAGVNMQIPCGAQDVFQNTGSLSVTPYLSVGKNFLKDFHFQSTTGFAIGDNARTDYFFSSYHLSYDVGGLHRFYPLIELNWFHYYKNGGTIPINFEGRDLINFGAQSISGQNSLTLAPGMRYKIGGNDNMQFGFALEFPLIKTPDLLDFRLTMDFILRY